MLHAIAAAVAAVENSDARLVKEDMLQRLSLIIARCSGSRIARRLRETQPDLSSGARRTLLEARLLEEP